MTFVTILYGLYVHAYERLSQLYTGSYHWGSPGPGPYREVIDGGIRTASGSSATRKRIFGWKRRCLAEAGFPSL